MQQPLTLGPFGEGTLRQQAQTWIDYLNQAKLSWWAQHKRATPIRESIRALEDGLRPSKLLLSALEQGMRRAAVRWPYVVWCAQGTPPALGFWPDRAKLGLAQHEGTITARLTYGLTHRPPAGFCMDARTVGRWQRYWILYDDGEYGLYTLYGRPIWTCQGRWTYANEPGQVASVLDS